MDNHLLIEQMHETISRVMVKIVMDRRIARPGEKLRINAGDAAVMNAIAHGLHVLVYVAVEHAPEAFFSGE